MKNKIPFWLGIFLISFSVSSLGVYWITGIFSANLSEMLLIPGFLLLSFSNNFIRRILINNLESKKFFILSFLLIVFFIIGVVTGDSVSSVYADFRAILFFGFFSTLKCRNENEQITLKKVIYLLLTGISIMDTIFLSLAVSRLQISDTRFFLITVAPFILSMHYLVKEKYVFSLFFLSLLILQSVMSSMRLNFIFIVLYLIYLILHTLSSFHTFRKKTFMLVLFVSLVSFIALIITPVISVYLEADGTRYLHSVLRTEKLLENPEEEEVARINSTLLLFNEPMQLIIPQGLGTRNHTTRVQSLFLDKYNILSSADSNIFYCVYHFGLMLGIYVIYLIFKTIIKNLYRIWRSREFIDFIYYLVVAIAFLSLFLTKTWIFMYLSFGVVYSFLIFLIRYPDKAVKPQN